MTVNATLIHTTMPSINEAIEDGEYEQDGILHYDRNRNEADFDSDEPLYFRGILKITEYDNDTLKIVTDEYVWLFGINRW